MIGNDGTFINVDPQISMIFGRRQLVDFLELPIGYYPIDLLLDKIAALLLLQNHKLAGILRGLLLVWWLLTADVVALPHKDLVEVKNFKLLLVDTLASILVGILG